MRAGGTTATHGGREITTEDGLSAVVVHGRGLVPTRPDGFELSCHVAVLADSGAEAEHTVRSTLSALETLGEDLPVLRELRTISSVATRDDPTGAFVDRAGRVRPGYSQASVSWILDDIVVTVLLDRIRSLLHAGGDWEQTLSLALFCRVDDDNPARAQACLRAVEAARSRAEAFADANGGQVGPLLSINRRDTLPHDPFELRPPLSPIRGYTEILRRKRGEAPPPNPRPQIDALRPQSVFISQGIGIPIDLAAGSDQMFRCGEEVCSIAEVRVDVFADVVVSYALEREHVFVSSYPCPIIDVRGSAVIETGPDLLELDVHLGSAGETREDAFAGLIAKRREAEDVFQQAPLTMEQAWSKYPHVQMMGASHDMDSWAWIPHGFQGEAELRGLVNDIAGFERFVKDDRRLVGWLPSSNEQPSEEGESVWGRIAVVQRVLDENPVRNDAAAGACRHAKRVASWFAAAAACEVGRAMKVASGGGCPEAIDALAIDAPFGLNMEDFAEGRSRSVRVGASVVITFELNPSVTERGYQQMGGTRSRAAHPVRREPSTRLPTVVAIGRGLTETRVDRIEAHVSVGAAFDPSSVALEMASHGLASIEAFLDDHGVASSARTRVEPVASPRGWSIDEGDYGFEAWGYIGFAVPDTATIRAWVADDPSIEFNARGPDEPGPERVTKTLWFLYHVDLENPARAEASRLAAFHAWRTADRLARGLFLTVGPPVHTSTGGENPEDLPPQWRRVLALDPQTQVEGVDDSAPGESDRVIVEAGIEIEFHLIG